MRQVNPNTVRTCGTSPYEVALLHGGPGAAGELSPVATIVSESRGVLELLQTGHSAGAQIEELRAQLDTSADLPVTLVGYSWGAWLGILFSARFPSMVLKLILISAAAFESPYVEDLADIRVSRLHPELRREAKQLLEKVRVGDVDGITLRRFGELMSIADSYAYQPLDAEEITLNAAIFQSVWHEASGMRSDGSLLAAVEKVKCPVVAIHGADDPHPAEGVETPLATRLRDFRMIRLKRCGHTPWNEKYARTKFFEILRDEIPQNTEHSVIRKGEPDDS